MPPSYPPPDWIADLAPVGRVLPDELARMRLAIALARENVLRGTGGPFGAVIVERASGRLVAAGVNSVVRLHCSILHAEVVALMVAQARRRSWTLDDPALPALDLFTSCAPCAMCLGAILWSGVRRVVMGARKEDAEAIGFDEGPVTTESYAHLARRGIEVVRDVARDEARAVFDLYRERGGTVYNG